LIAIGSSLNCRDRSYCALRSVKITVPFRTYCANYSQGASKIPGAVAKGWIFASGIYERYVRIPWHGDVESLVNVYATCSVCGCKTKAGVEVKASENSVLGLCSNRHYVQWWKTQHDDASISADRYADPGGHVKHIRIGIWLYGIIMLTTGHAFAAPCTTTAECTEWVVLPQNSARVLIYRSFPLSVRNPDITRALVVIHGAGRDADNYFRHALAAAFLAGGLENTVIISPRFASTNGDGCADKVSEREATWQCGGPSRWTGGGASVDNRDITSFDVIDQILRTLARKDSFPNLRTIVVAGHSAGGQFVSRYQMANQVHETLGIPLSYVVSNPSSYAYLEAVRPSVTLLSANVSALGPGYVATLPATPTPPFVAFADARNCTTYDNWPYGIQRRVGYSAKLTDDQLKKQLSARGATYLLGGLDILPLFGFDGSCAANAQGPTRLARGLAFSRYVVERLGAKHEALIVPACGHNARCMFTADAALGLLFPKQ